MRRRVNFVRSSGAPNAACAGWYDLWRQEQLKVPRRTGGSRRRRFKLNPAVRSPRRVSCTTTRLGNSFSNGSTMMSTVRLIWTGRSERVNENEARRFMIQALALGSRGEFRGDWRPSRDSDLFAPRPGGDEAPLPLDPLYPPEGLAPPGRDCRADSDRLLGRSIVHRRKQNESAR